MPGHGSAPPGDRAQHPGRKVHVERSDWGFHTAYGSVTVDKSETPEGPAAYVRNFGVQSEKRGLTHGIALGRAVTAEADAEGRTLYTHARPALHKAYSRAGFEVVKDHPWDLFGGDQPFLRRRPRPQ